MKPYFRQLTKKLDPAFAWDNSLGNNLSLFFEEIVGEHVFDFDEFDLFKSQGGNASVLDTFIISLVGADNETRMKTAGFYSSFLTMMETYIRSGMDHELQGINDAASAFLANSRNNFPYPYPNFTQTTFGPFLDRSIDKSSRAVHCFLNVLYCFPPLAEPYQRAFETALVKNLITASIKEHENKKEKQEAVMKAGGIGKLIRAVIYFYWHVNYLVRTIFNYPYPVLCDYSTPPAWGIPELLVFVINRAASNLLATAFDNHIIQSMLDDPDTDIVIPAVELLFFMKDFIKGNYFSRYARDGFDFDADFETDLNEHVVVNDRSEKEYYQPGFMDFFSFISCFNLLHAKTKPYFDEIKSKHENKVSSD
jgi:hypothetical protein